MVGLTVTQMPPDPTSASVWVTVIGILTVLASAVVGIYTARSARAANRETSQLSGWRDMVKESREEINRLREDRAEDEEKWRKERDAERAAMAECHRRIDALTVRFEAAERRERALILWAREVVRIMQLADLTFPPPPRGVNETDPNGHAPVSG